MENPLLDIQHARKTYNGTVAVNDISLQVPRGRIFGLLGPNGAGKTSLIRMITRITLPDGGRILLNGKEITDDDTGRIGYMPEERGLYKQMKIGDHLIYLGELRGLQRAAAVEHVRRWFDKFQIQDWWNKKVDQLSKGMQQKIQFVAAVLHDPDLLILDEPFSGLDPINSDLITEEIRALKNAGRTILFSTHRMEQVEQICDSIALIDRGDIVLHGEVSELRKRFRKNLYRVEYTGTLAPLPEGMSVTAEGEGFAVIHTSMSPNELLRHVLQSVEVHGFFEILPTLHEIFVEVVSGGQDAAK